MEAGREGRRIEPARCTADAARPAGDVQDGRYTPCATTVLELGNRRLTGHVQPNLKLGAVVSYRGTFCLHIAAALGSVRVDDCEPQTARAMLGRKRAEGVGAQGVAKIRRQMHAMFAFAQDAGLLSANPADLTRAAGGSRIVAVAAPS